MVVLPSSQSARPLTHSPAMVLSARTTDSCQSSSLRSWLMETILSKSALASLKSSSQLSWRPYLITTSSSRVLFSSQTWLPKVRPVPWRPAPSRLPGWLSVLCPAPLCQPFPVSLSSQGDNRRSTLPSISTQWTSSRMLAALGPLLSRTVAHFSNPCLRHGSESLRTFKLPRKSSYREQEQTVLHRRASMPVDLGTLPAPTSRTTLTEADQSWPFSRIIVHHKYQLRLQIILPLSQLHY